MKSTDANDMTSNAGGRVFLRISIAEPIYDRAKKLSERAMENCDGEVVSFFDCNSKGWSAVVCAATDKIEALEASSGIHSIMHLSSYASYRLVLDGLRL